MSVEPSSKPQTNSPDPESVPKSESVNPEPQPEWDTALHEWSYWWEIHNFGFGCVFIGLALFSLLCIFRLRSTARSLTLGRYFTCVSGLLLVFSLSRAFYLLLDPYEAHKLLTLPVIVVRVLFAVGYPCLTAVFSLINFAFIEVNNIWLITRRLQNAKFLASVIITHFVIVLVVYIVIYYTLLAKLFILCEGILVIWWLVLAALFIYSAWKVSWHEKVKKKFYRKSADQTEKDYKYKTTQPQHESKKTSQNDYADINRKGTKRIARISGLVALLGILSSILELYSLFGVYNLYHLTGTFVAPWPWWGYQTGSRVVEVCLSCVVAYVVYPTIMIQRREKSETYNASNSHQMSSVTVNTPTALKIDMEENPKEIYV